MSQVARTVTCRTEGCENENISFIFTSLGDQVMCGACGNYITDIEPPLPPLPELEEEEE